MVELIEECSSMEIKKIPKKLNDPKSFTLPTKIDERDMVYALSDLEKGINLIPLLVFNILSLKKTRPCFVVLQMVDKTRVQPKGIIEDVLITVGEFIISTDFTILN